MIYADANVIIRLLEGLPVVRAPIESRLLPFQGIQQFLATSRLSRLECRCKPVRMANNALLALYDSFFLSRDVVLLEVDSGVIEKATELRALLNVKTPDAIHLASAIMSRATSFLTADRGLQRCTEIAVEIV